ncbi:MAG: SRPBCC domain-containing protein [Anaerolineae bacterium]|nr:SRPBCC domain-containing protein [Anaerolineae bacterium]
MTPRSNLTGQTRDAGWQMGARRTFPVTPARAWEWLLSPEGLADWLGAGAQLDLVGGALYTLPDGTRGEVRVFKPGSHLRLTWQPPGWQRPSTIQVRVLSAKRGSTLAFHQEHLPDANARAERLAHFQAVLDGLAAQLS